MSKLFWERLLLIIAVGIFVLLAIDEAKSAEVYRCGNTYQDFPCTNGREVQLTYDRTPAPIYVPPISSGYYEPVGGGAINIGPGHNVYLRRHRR